MGERKALRAVAEYGSPLASRALRVLDLPKGTAVAAARRLVADGLLERDDGWVVDPLQARWLREVMPTRSRPG